MGWVGDGVGLGSVTWVACGLVLGIGLRRLGCGCGRRLVTGSCVYLRDDPDGSSAVLAARFSIYLSIYLVLRASDERVRRRRRLCSPRGTVIGWAALSRARAEEW